ncbi:POK25 protein, partial [Locustella ochotensis]|nr:POK25 protein [Locustella ochotensis]
NSAPDQCQHLADLQQLLGEINWVRPVLGISNNELPPLFNLLRGDCDITSPRTLKLKQPLKKNHRSFPNETSPLLC